MLPLGAIGKMQLNGNGDSVSKPEVALGRNPGLSGGTALASLALSLDAGTATAEVCNLKIVTDASPDYSDLPSLLQAESPFTSAVQPSVLAPETRRV